MRNAARHNPQLDISDRVGRTMAVRPRSSPSPLGRSPARPTTMGATSSVVHTDLSRKEELVLFEIEHLTDADLLARVHDLTHHDHLATARFVAHLMEFDSRRLYVAEGFPSLFAYCTQVLHFSEYTAYRRIEAARVAARFPVVLERIADGSVHLTAVTLLAPHLTPENHLALLESARHRTRRQIESILAHLTPGRERPVRGYVVPLPPTGSMTTHTIERGPVLFPGGTGHDAVGGGLFDRGAFIGGISAGGLQDDMWPDGESFKGGAIEGRRIEAGSIDAGAIEGGRIDASPGSNMDWHHVAVSTGVEGGILGSSRQAHAAPGEPFSSGNPSTTGLDPWSGDHQRSELPGVGFRGPAGAGSTDSSLTSRTPAAVTGSGATQPASAGELANAGGYRLHVTISASTYRKLERARLLMSHANPSGDLATVLDRALGVLVDLLERRKFAALQEPGEDRKACSPRKRAAARRSDRRKPDRHIPASVRRAVWRRDAGQCTFEGRSGNRCQAGTLLEYHHLVAWARGGPSTLENLTLRCRAHNAHDAEHSMGRRFRSTRTGASCDAFMGGGSAAAPGGSSAAVSGAWSAAASAASTAAASGASEAARPGASCDPPERRPSVRSGIAAVDAHDSGRGERVPAEPVTPPRRWPRRTYRPR